MPLSALSPARPRVLSAAWGRARRAGGAVVPWIASKLPETVLQCVLIVISIVLALGVEEWKDARKERALKLQSLGTFERELQANRLELDQSVAYHASLHDLLAHLDSTGELRTPEEFYGTLGVQGFQPGSLRATAWQTAMATGVLRLLNYPTVDALSITYGLQADHERKSEQRLPDFLRTGTAPPGSTRSMVRSATRYMSDETQEEQKLLATYDSALAKISAARRQLQ
jgi:hypothetical protein